MFWKREGLAAEQVASLSSLSASNPPFPTSRPRLFPVDLPLTNTLWAFGTWSRLTTPRAPLKTTCSATGRTSGALTLKSPQANHTLITLASVAAIADAAAGEHSAPLMIRHSSVPTLQRPTATVPHPVGFR